MSFSLLKIFVPGPFWEPLDYLIPHDWTTLPKPGARVLVPLRNREVVGIVAAVSQEGHTPAHKLKWAITVLDDEPLFDATYFDFLKWLADYYHEPLGDVCHLALPKSLRAQPKNSRPDKAQRVRQRLPDTLRFVRPTLTPAQDNAIRQILSTQNTFQTFLLNGVTGSGKTEVYLQVIEAIVKQGQQALVLVPEIGLTPQTLARFQQRFGDKVVALHSGLSEKKRGQAWLAAKQTETQVIIGTRSAVFAPFKNLGVIIIDEEHDSSFKQHDGIRYSARDAAVVRGNLLNIPVVLGSATPSFETWLNAKKNRYWRIDLPERTAGALMPNWLLIDLRQKKCEEGLSQVMLEAIAKHLQAGQQVLLFLNRRGFAPAWICHQCGWAPDCKHCDTKLTYHAKPPKLVCHHCGAIHKVHYACTHCHQKMAPLGLGTQRLEEALQQRFPEVPILRIDRDSTSRKNSFDKMIAQVHEGHPQILLGTQMIAKGHHFPQVTMVGVLNADIGLYSADFRAPEHLAQLILQVAGRAGRAEAPGEVYVQTYWADHPLWQDLMQTKGYERFCEDGLRQRELALLPPYRYAAMIRAEAREPALAETFLAEEAFHAKAYQVSEVAILGPIAALQAKRAGYYRSQLLLISPHRQALQQLLKQWIPTLAARPQSHKVRWHLDVDPMEFD